MHEVLAQGHPCRSIRGITQDLTTAQEVSEQTHAGGTAKAYQLFSKQRNCTRGLDTGTDKEGLNTMRIISILAMVEFLFGACLVEGGTFGLGTLAMAMPLAWFGLLLLKYGR